MRAKSFADRIRQKCELPAQALVMCVFLLVKKSIQQDQQGMCMAIDAKVQKKIRRILFEPKLHYVFGIRKNGLR